MKISLLLTEGGAQVTLTPEDKQEQAILGIIHGKSQNIELKQGPVVARTQGGYWRDFDERPNTLSTCIVLTPVVEPAPREPQPSDD